MLQANCGLANFALHFANNGSLDFLSPRRNPGKRAHKPMANYSGYATRLPDLRTHSA